MIDHEVEITRLVVLATKRACKELGRTSLKDAELLEIVYRIATLYWRSLPLTREARIEEIERRRDTVLAECNPNLPTYEAK